MLAKLYHAQMEDMATLSNFMIGNNVHCVLPENTVNQELSKVIVLQDFIVMLVQLHIMISVSCVLKIITAMKELLYPRDALMEEQLQTEVLNLQKSVNHAKLVIIV